MSIKVHIDYEVRSCIDLKACGAHRYAVDGSTEILMAGVSEHPLDAPIYLWINPKFATADVLGDNAEAEDLLARADILTAHSAPFEQAVTWGAAQRGAASPFKKEPDISKWRCTAAMARRAGLPWSLEKMAEALSLKDQKDAKGKTLIRFFCIPRKDGGFNDPKDFSEKWAEFCSYCVTDVKVEKQGDHKLKAFELQGQVLEGFLFDLRMNQRGVPVNVTALTNAQKIIDTVEASVTKEFVHLTGVNPTQREKVRLLVGLENMQSETVEAAITDPLIEEKTRKILQLYSKLSYAAIKKVQTMIGWACPDSRMRGVFRWYGASTGRWTAGGPQMQNAKKATKEMRPITFSAYEAIQRGISSEGIECIYGEPYEVIASSIRHFIHEPSYEMFDADYNAIEGRIACWIAGETEILKAWREGVDLYKRAAAFVFEVPENSIGKGEKRDFGKVAELACFSPDTLVLTSFGYKKIIDVTTQDSLWDGVDWVRTEGLICRGQKPVIEIAGVRLTSDHLVLCGKVWRPAIELGSNERSFLQALETASATLLSPDFLSVRKVDCAKSWCNAPVAHLNIKSTFTRFDAALPHAALPVLESNKLSPTKNTGSTSLSSQISRSEDGYLTASELASHVAIALMPNNTEIMEVEASTSSLRGLKIKERFLDTSLHLKGMTIRFLRWIGSMLTRATSQGTSDSSLNEPTSLIEDLYRFFSSEFSSSKPKSYCFKASLVYDLINCGPRNRFTILTDRGPLIVHNCQFGLGVDGFIRTCDSWNIPCTSELAERAIHGYYRPTHPKIVDRWWVLDGAMKRAITQPGTMQGPFTVRTIAGIKFLLLKLPSGRSLAYPHPEVNRRLPTEDEKKQMEAGKNFPESRFLEVTYWGQLFASTQWGRIRLWGSKVFENEIQAVAADFMTHGALTAEKRGMPPFMLVHDQALALKTNGRTAKDFEMALGDLPEWAKGFPMKVECHECRWYAK